MIASTASVARRRNSGRSATGTETSLLMLPPFVKLHLGHHLPDVPEVASLLERGGERGVGHEFRLDGLGEHGSRRRRVAPSSRWLAISISAYQGWALASGSRVPRRMAQHEFQADARHQLEGGQLARRHLLREVEEAGGLLDGW